MKLMPKLYFLVAILLICIIAIPFIAFLILGGGQWLDKITFDANKEARLGEEYLEAKYKEEFNIRLNSVKYKGYEKNVTFVASPEDNSELYFTVQADSQKKSLYKDNYMLNKAIRFITSSLSKEDQFYYDAISRGGSFYSTDISPGVEAKIYIQQIKDYSIQINLFIALDLNEGHEGIIQVIEPFINKIKESGLTNVHISLFYPWTSQQDQQKAAFENIKKMRMNNELDNSVLQQSSFKANYTYNSCSIDIPNLGSNENLASYIKKECSELDEIFKN